MPLARASLWLLGVVVGSFLPGVLCGSPSHSLCYSYLQLSEPSRELPPSFIRGYLDDQPIARYDSHTRKTEPLVPWVDEAEEERFRVLEWVFGMVLEEISEPSRQTGRLHTWQASWGCELREDGSKRGYFHYGYDGMDFLSFEKETLRWVAAQTQAQKVKEKWEDDPGWTEKMKDFLEETCIEWLERYLFYGKEALERTEPPMGKVTRKMVDDSLENLICQAYGFYPKEIQATWTRDGEVWEEETLRRNVAPNSDGTYYVWLSIEISPKERDRFRCHLEHEGLQEPLVLAFKEETATLWKIPVGIGAAIILGAGILFLSYKWWRYRKNFHHKGTTHPITVLQKKLPSTPICGTEDDIQPLLMLQPKIRSKHNTTYGGRRPQRDPEDPGSTLPNGEWKQLIIDAVAAAAADTVVADYDYDYDYFNDYVCYHVYYFTYYFTKYSGETEPERETESQRWKGP